VVARQVLPALFGATAVAVPAGAVAAATPLASPVAAISTAQPNPEARVEGIDRPAAALAWLEANEPASFDIPAQPEPDERLSRLPPSPQYVAVRGGDSLWSIAAEHLGPNTTTADIASEWPRWFAANRDEIGPDPDLLHVGTLLAIPAHR
jgi:nucleoid-associated protein YgaU